jgi:phenylacetate-CoA ligase
MTRGGPAPEIPQSAVPGIVWPAFPRTPSRADLRRALLRQIEATQWWSSDRLRAWQLRQAGRLLDHAARRLPFYRARLDAAGYRPGQAPTPELWSRLPVLTRAAVQEAGTALHATPLPRGHAPALAISTSGSTGRPLTALTTPVTRQLWLLFTLRDHLWHRRDLRGKFAVIRSLPEGEGLYPRGARHRSWGPAFAGLYRSGPSVALSVLASTDEQADWLAREDPDYLLCYPSALAELARRFRKTGATPPRLKQIATFAEALPSGLRAACREVFGVELKDIYSAQELGYLALQCPEQAHYHGQDETVLLEVLRDDGTPCAAGEVGRVVATPLHNFAMPLIRYEIGDLAVRGAACPCGRGLSVLTRILGRSRNLLTLPDGRRLWPRLSEGRYVEVPALKQFQLVQKTRRRLEMRVVAEPPLTAEDEARLRAIVLARIGHPFEIDFVPVDAIPRGPGGKYEDFASELPDD